MDVNVSYRPDYPKVGARVIQVNDADFKIIAGFTVTKSKVKKRLPEWILDHEPALSPEINGRFPNYIAGIDPYDADKPDSSHIVIYDANLKQFLYG